MADFQERVITSPAMQFDPLSRSQPLQYLGRYGFSLALVAFSSIAFCVRRTIGSVRESYAESWPMVNGRVTKCDVKTIHGHLGDYALGQIGYAYEVEGNYYSGYYVRQYFDEQRAWTFVDARRDTPVLVRYKTSFPETSVLRAQDQVGGL